MKANGGNHQDVVIMLSGGQNIAEFGKKAKDVCKIM
jgi:hypothetical protein